LSGIIALTICINYSDYLANTLAYNRQYFTEYYIVTDKTDLNTIQLAKDNSCKLLYYHIKHLGDAAFNKSGLLYHVQKKIHQTYPDNWIAIIDADILLSNKFKYLDPCGI
jgi:predicted glycosyltransferase involved in capsule biosynthesis